jgi:hypothetical protein
MYLLLNSLHRRRSKAMCYAAIGWYSWAQSTLYRSALRYWSLECSHSNLQIVTIKCWNIGGAFSLQMSCPEFRKDLEQFDINLFSEIHLRPQQHDTVELPRGYSILSRTRGPKASFDKSWGGVAAVYRSAL